MINYPLYLVPFDFTSVSEDAMNLALELARVNDGSIFMLHVVGSPKEKTVARKRMNTYVETLSEEDQKRITTSVVSGIVYEDVGKASEILRPNLVVLGTHGAKGFQKFFGSHMDKMIYLSASPLLITHGKRSLETIRNIVMPFNFNKESLQITSFATAMAKKFNACIHLVAEHDRVETHEEKINNNQAIVKRYLEDNDVTHTMVNLPNTESFEKELMDYASNVHADIIAETYTNDNFMGTTNMHMKRMIENDMHIPILTYSTESLSQTYY